MKKDSFFVWLGKYVNGWVLLGAGVVLVLIVLFWGAVLWAFSPVGPKVIIPSAEITIIPAPTLTAVQAKTPTMIVTTPIQETEASGYLLGSLLEVVGTGEDGLRIRSDPGIEGTIHFVARDGKRFIVMDGPKEVDGYTWYYLVSEEDKTVKGWGASTYLQLVPEP